MPIRRRSPVAKEIAILRGTLRRLDHSFGRLAPMLAVNAAGTVTTAGQTGRRLPRLSAKARAALKLQGRYMGYVRQLRPKQKARIRKVRAVQGVRTAIARARTLAKA